VAKLGFDDDAAARTFQMPEQVGVAVLDQQIMHRVAGDEPVDAGAEQHAALQIACIAWRRDCECVRLVHPAA